MQRKPSAEPKMRMSVTLPLTVYRSLEDIAKRKKVSLAWVMRDAAERYVSEEWPLFGRKNQ